MYSRRLDFAVACLDALPKTTDVLLFDTLFHQTLPKEVYTYAVPKQEPGALNRSIPLRKVRACLWLWHVGSGPTIAYTLTALLLLSSTVSMVSLTCQSWAPWPRN